jgi:nucleoid DNA-binding protein
MEQLVNQITQRTGISADKARTAVDTVVGYLKERLPEPIASKLDGKK